MASSMKFFWPLTYFQKLLVDIEREKYLLQFPRIRIGIFCLQSTVSISLIPGNSQMSLDVTDFGKPINYFQFAPPFSNFVAGVYAVVVPVS